MQIEGKGRAHVFASRLRAKSTKLFFYVNGFGCRRPDDGYFACYYNPFGLEFVVDVRQRPWESHNRFTTCLIKSAQTNGTGPVDSLSANRI